MVCMIHSLDNKIYTKKTLNVSFLDSNTSAKVSVGNTDRATECLPPFLPSRLDLNRPSY